MFLFLFNFPVTFFLSLQICIWVDFNTILSLINSQILSTCYAGIGRMNHSMRREKSHVLFIFIFIRISWLFERNENMYNFSHISKLWLLFYLHCPLKKTESNELCTWKGFLKKKLPILLRSSISLILLCTEYICLKINVDEIICPDGL